MSNQDLYSDMIAFFVDLVNDGFDLAVFIIGGFLAILCVWLIYRATIGAVRSLRG